MNLNMYIYQQDRFKRISLFDQPGLWMLELLGLHFAHM